MAEESLENQFLDTPQAITGLRARVVRGGFWVFALRITTRLFGLVRTIILARLLAPADFGLFGIALLAMSALQTFSQTGFGAALIQKKEDIKLYLDTAWTVQVIRGAVLGLIAFAIAPYVANFFDTPAAKPILQVIAFSVLLQGFTNIGVVYFRKELEFNKLFVYQLGGTVANIGVAISAAFLLRNVWALVFGLLAGTVVRLVLSYFIHPYRPRVRFNSAKAKELYTFGRWILASCIVVFLATQGDDIFLGKLLGATALGFYQLSFRLSTAMSSEITGTISKVTFPAYSKLQCNIGRLSNAYLRTMKFSTMITIPLAGGLFILAPEFTNIFLGEKWTPIIPCLRVLAIMGIIRSIVGTGGALILSVGKPKWDFILNIIRVGTIAASIYPLTVLWGISGTALSTLIGIVATLPIWLYLSINETSNRTIDYLKALLPPLAGTLIMCLMIIFFKSLMSSFHLPQFISAVLVGIFAYFVAMVGIEKTTGYRFLQEAGTLLTSLRKKEFQQTI